MRVIIVVLAMAFLSTQGYESNDSRINIFVGMALYGLILDIVEAIKKQ